jgi:hypothetical protein
MRRLSWIKGNQVKGCRHGELFDASSDDFIYLLVCFGMLDKTIFRDQKT